MRNSKGFTLIEVMIASVLLFGAVVGLGAAWRGTALTLAKSKKMNVITSLLQQKATEYEIKFKKEFPTDEKEESGDFEDFPELKWKVIAKPLEFPDLTPLLISQEKDGADEMFLTVIKQMTDYFSKSIFELKVSVFWERKGKSLEYSVVTYLVSYENEVGIPGQ